MNIILVSSRLARAITLETRTVALGLGCAFLLIAGGAFMLGSFFSSDSTSTPLRRFIPGATSRQAEIDALAVKLGELQAKLMRLDGFAKQVGSKTGITAEPFLSSQPVPRGGVATPGEPLSASSMLQQIIAAEQQIIAYQDQFNLAQSLLMLPKMANLPVTSPVPSLQNQSSGFGARIDPLNGRQTFHEGIDFPGEIGTPIHATGNGTVIFAAYHPEYGNMIDLDHGNGLVSRYAHNSKLNVSEGDKVIAGQVIALLGNTGRSTGAHMHFEIRYKNVPQNPLRFLMTEAVVNKKSATMP